MWAILVLALFMSAVAAVPRNPPRIVGGTLTTIDEYPTIAALLYSFDLSMYIHGCGGSIINQQSILTAAHCTYYDQPINWRVRIGSTWRSRGGDIYQIGYIANHPNYNAQTYDNDVAILRTSSNMVFNNNARPALIAGPNYAIADNSVVYAAGWGLTFPGGPYSDQLRHVLIWSVNQAICRQRYASVGSEITDNMMCSGWLDVGGRDQCQGDSGGPLYHNNIVVGVCSVGYGCGDAYYPGVNTRISRYTNWIQANA